ncbi:MAG: response regulator [bacterium]|nr:response regulator [bacterium]
MSDERAATTAGSILIVDDERFFREAIRDILGAEGFDCETCEDGEGALKLIATRTFAVAIVDIRLPGVDGIEVLRQLRAAQGAIRVIMLSCASDQERVLEALRSGACDYLAKPLHDEELVLAVSRAAGDHRVASEFGRMRHCVDDLADLLEGFAQEVEAATAAERPQVLRAAAARTAARALGAEKSSLMLLDEVEERLDVVAVTGRDLAPEAMDPVGLGQGIAGRALEDRAPLVVVDIRAESHLADDFSPERYDSTSFAVAPVVIGERAFGVLCATDCRGGVALHGEDLALLRLVAVQVAERLREEADRRDPFDLDPGLGDDLAEELPDELTGELDLASPAGLEEPDPGVSTRDNALGPDPGISTGEMMPLDLAREVADAARIVGDASDVDAELARQICDAMANELQPEALLREVLRPIERALQADPVSLYLIDNTSGELVLEARGERGLRVDRERLPTAGGLTGAVLQRGQLVASSDPEADPRFDPAIDTPTDHKAGPLLCVPLQLRGKTIGLARIHPPQGASVSARTGEVLAGVLSAAVRNVLLYRSLLESIEEVAEARREARG